MREILFRGKRTDNGDWVEGYLLKECNYVTCSWNQAIEFRTDRFGKFAYDVAEITPETVGQFTGLTDKNGQKIFEGDIVRITDDDGNTNFSDGGIGAVEFYEGLWYVCGMVHNGLYDLHKCYFIEVIGSVHDNPELLGGEVNEKDCR